MYYQLPTRDIINFESQCQLTTRKVTDNSSHQFTFYLIINYVYILTTITTTKNIQCKKSLLFLIKKHEEKLMN
jgi:ABC-type arginine transport system permease subunit